MRADWTRSGNAGHTYAYSIVRDNRFIYCNGEAEVISNKSSGNQYIHNYFEDCQGELVMRGGHDCLIRHLITRWLTIQ